MHNWDDLRFCLALERYHTMTAAAKALGTNTATVSRRIERLTEVAGAPLFIRDNTTWIATELGKEFAEIAGKFEDRINTTASQSSEMLGKRHLHLTLSDTILAVSITPRLADLFDQISDLEFQCSHDNASLAYGETDLEISHTEPTEGRVIRKKLGMMRYNLYYNPKFTGKLTGWASVVTNNDIEGDFSVLKAFGDTPKIQLCNIDRLVDCVNNLPVLAVLPSDFAMNHPNLVEYASTTSITKPVWGSYHYTRKTDPLLKQMTQWLEKGFHTHH